MACRALDVYRGEARAGSPEVRPELHGRELFSNLNLTEVTDTEDSKELNSLRGPMIIVSASGMATGGRVIHHLAHRISDNRNAVMLVGFQAPGTRGDALRNGVRQLKMLGRYHRVRAEVVSVDLSIHADQSELLDWMRTASPQPRQVYVNHGEDEASAALVDHLQKDLGVGAVRVRPGERVRLDPLGGGGRRGGVSP
jgi:metallo-beta-lactamase family protein